jgi:hypothetical protein
MPGFLLHFRKGSSWNAHSKADQQGFMAFEWTTKTCWRTKGKVKNIKRRQVPKFTKFTYKKKAEGVGCTAILILTWKFPRANRWVPAWELLGWSHTGLAAPPSPPTGRLDCSPPRNKKTKLPKSFLTGLNAYFLIHNITAFISADKDKGLKSQH